MAKIMNNKSKNKDFGLDFFHIDKNYIQFLRDSGHDSVENNYDGKNNQKPYLGVVIRINGYNYFAPLSSPKPKYFKTADSNPTMFKIIKRKKDGKLRLLGVVRLNNMLPVPREALTHIEINKIEDLHYKNLLLSERRVILSNVSKIKYKARKMYNLITNKRNEFYLSISNDFPAIEKLFRQYINQKENEDKYKQRKPLNFKR